LLIESDAEAKHLLHMSAYFFTTRS